MLFLAFQTRSWTFSRASTLVNFLGQPLPLGPCEVYSAPINSGLFIAATVITLSYSKDYVLRNSFVLVAAIGNAFAVLSNPDKRLRYDEYGDEQQVTFTAPRARPYHYYRDFEADITPEELFNVFFGGQFPTGQYPKIIMKKFMYQQALV